MFDHQPPEISPKEANSPPPIGAKRYENTQKALERNNEFVNQQTGLAIAGYLGRLAYAVKTNESILNQMNSFQTVAAKEPPEKYSQRLYQAAKQIALNHNPNQPLDFTTFQQQASDFNLTPTDILALREYITMDREAIRSLHRTIQANAEKANLLLDPTGVLSKQGLIKLIVTNNEILTKQQAGELMQRRNDGQPNIPPILTEPGVCLVIDIDNLKKHNDTYGHPWGDEVIKTVATALRESVRSSDVVCRYGGDEFIVFLPKLNVIDNPEEIEVIHRRITDKLNVVPNQPEITLSVGASNYQPETVRRVKDQDSLNQLIEKADQAAGKSKAEGKNRLTLA